jgi:hypothetical protein
VALAVGDCASAASESALKPPNTRAARTDSVLRNRVFILVDSFQVFGRDVGGLNAVRADMLKQRHFGAAQDWRQENFTEE